MFEYSYIHKRNVDVVFSAMQPLIKIRLWNIETFECLNRTLNCWLDGEVAEGEKIRRIQWLESMLNQNGEVHVWVYIKTDINIQKMMYTMYKIV